ncbi:hypothetical protein Bbelb_017150 [Branchiostoma belcheri]|nr:hypothetical protein Bbelb_017150 [Branchiostoma belcheri]
MARQLGRVAWHGDDFACCCSSGDSCLNLTREDWTRTDDLKTQEEYQDCLNLTRLARRRPGYLETQEQDDIIHRCVLSAGCLVWEKPVMTAVSKPVDLKMQKEMKTSDVQRNNADSETSGLQQEEEPDFWRQGCVKEDGEE